MEVEPQTEFTNSAHNAERKLKFSECIAKAISTISSINLTVSPSLFAIQKFLIEAL